MMLNSKKNLWLRSFILLVLFFIPNLVLGYVSLVPNTPLSSAASSGNLQEFLKKIYEWGVGIAVALAILFIIFGGIEYMTTDSVFKKDEGKKRITAAVAGLLIVLSSWLILNQINPRIFTNNDLGLDSGQIDSAKPLSTGPVDTTKTTDIPNYQGSEEFTASGDAYNPTLTAYSPQKSGSLLGMEGGYQSSRPGLDGRSVVRTLDDYVAGRSSYVTLAGDSSQYGKAYTIPTITYKNSFGQLVTVNNVKGYVHDTGSAFTGAGSSKFDVPIGKDYTDYQMNTQPFNGNNIQFVPATIKK